MLAQEFMRNAFLAGGGIALAAAFAGYFLVLRNQVFAGESLSHVAFTGALAALALGADPLLGLVTITVAAAVALGAIGGHSRGRDVVVGTVFAWVLGLGVLFLSLHTTSQSSSNGVAGVNVLFGSIFGISAQQAVISAAVAVAVMIALAIIARPLLFATLSPDAAAGRGIPVRLLGLIFLTLTGVTVAVAVQAVGALLVLGLMVTPAAIALRVTARPFAAMALSVALGLVFVWTGLALSHTFQRVPPSVCIIALGFAGYVVTVIATASPVRRRLGGFSISL
ncbi:MAG: metal ABC transporter permease [Candidatus Dormibacteria bacterium]